MKNYIIGVLIVFSLFSWALFGNHLLNKKIDVITFEEKEIIEPAMTFEEVIAEEKPIRKVGHIQNELTDILREVADELEYNSKVNIPANSNRIIDWVATKNDQNNDGKIDCVDYSILFKKKCDVLNIPCKIIVNEKLKHAFNAVQISNDSWVKIEPQARDGGYAYKKIVINSGEDFGTGIEYDKKYDVDYTSVYEEYLLDKK